LASQPEFIHVYAALLYLADFKASQTFGEGQDYGKDETRFFTCGRFVD
jgi:hypothetical protein